MAISKSENEILKYLVKKELERIKKERRTIIFPDSDIQSIKGGNEYEIALKNMLKKLQ